MSDVTVYANSGLSMSVCVPSEWDRNRTEREVNIHTPCGTEHGWFVSKDVTFKDGTSMPCQCNTDQRRRHWYIEC